jgi:hypothetical protein
LHDDGRSTSENERDLVAILDIARAVASCPSTPSMDTACMIQSIALYVIRELASASSVRRADLTKLLDYASRSVLEDLNFRIVMAHELLWWSETISEVAQYEKPEWTLRERLAGSRLPTLRTRFVRSWDPYYYEFPEDSLQWEKAVSAVGGAGDKFSESFFFFSARGAVKDPYTRLWKEVRESALQAAVAPTRIRNEQCVTLAWLNYRLSVLTGVSRELLPTDCDDCSVVITDSEFRVAAVQPSFAPWTESGIELKTKTFVLP